MATPRADIEKAITGIITQMTSDWDTDFEGEIGPSTRLIGDLSFESIDVVQFISQIETHYGRKDLPFEQLLMEDGRYVDELTLAQVTDFLAKHL